MFESLKNVMDFLGWLALLAGFHFVLAMASAFNSGMIQDGKPFWLLGMSLVVLITTVALARHNLYRRGIRSEKSNKNRVLTMYLIWFAYAFGVSSIIIYDILFRGPYADQSEEWGRVAMSDAAWLGVIAFVLGSYVKDRVLAYAWKKDRQQAI